MRKIVFLGSGAAPGVPSLSCGYGDCNPDNPYNTRSRTSVYLEYNGVKILIDTSPDLRAQLIKHNITDLDAILYTHIHADHLHGIDELREINRITGKLLDFYATKFSCKHICKTFPYLIAEGDRCDLIRRPGLVPHIIKQGEDFWIKDVKITPLKLLGHNVESVGYSFNDGELVYIADFKTLPPSTLKLIKKAPNLVVMPLTTPFEQRYHAGIEDVIAYIQKLSPQKAILNHLASECDYDAINASTPENVSPAYDNLIIEF